MLHASAPPDQSGPPAPHASRPLRILLVDDEPRVRQGLRMRLSHEPGIHIVGEAATIADALTQAHALQPDVILMDVSLRDGDGITATATLHALDPHCAVVILTIHDDATTRARARTAGACAFVAKHDGIQPLIQAIREASRR